MYIYIYIDNISRRGGRSPKVSLAFTYVVVCFGFIKDCFMVYLGLVYWILFRVYLRLVYLSVVLCIVVFGFYLRFL